MEKCVWCNRTIQASELTNLCTSCLKKLEVSESMKYSGARIGFWLALMAAAMLL